MSHNATSAVFVPIVLTADEAKAAANACAMAFAAMRGLASLDHPAFTAALKIEDALAAKGVIELERHKEADPIEGES